MKIESLNVVLAGQRKKVKRNVPLLFIYFFSMLLNIKNVMKLMKNYDQLLFRDSWKLIRILILWKISLTNQSGILFATI